MFSFSGQDYNFQVQLFSITCKQDFPIDLTEFIKGTVFCDKKILFHPKIRQFVTNNVLANRHKV